MKVLVVVDMQYDFINGSLGTPEAISIVSNVINKIKEFNNNNDEIIYTKDTHYDNYLNTLEGKNLPVEHCIKNTNGWNIPDEIYLKDKKCLHFGSRCGIILDVNESERGEHNERRTSSTIWKGNR